MLMHFFDAPAACACLCMFTMRTTLVSLPWLSKTQAFTLHLSFYKFLSESIKEWYFPWDDEYLRSFVKEKQHSQQCQHRELQTIEEIADMLCLQEHWNTELTTSNANRENPACCFVRLFKLYQSTWCSTSCFYLQPQKNQQQDAGTPTIHLANTVACLCKQAGIQGHKINHSLWATVASHIKPAWMNNWWWRGLVIAALMAFAATSKRQKTCARYHKANMYEQWSWHCETNTDSHSLILLHSTFPLPRSTTVLSTFWLGLIQVRASIKGGLLWLTQTD